MYQINDEHGEYQIVNVLGEPCKLRKVTPEMMKELFKKFGGHPAQVVAAPVPNLKPVSESKLRKELELSLLSCIESHIELGLDIKYVNVELSNGLDVRVVLNEATKIADKTTG